jgi:hypothetical protein
MKQQFWHIGYLCVIGILAFGWYWQGKALAGNLLDATQTMRVVEKYNYRAITDLHEEILKAVAKRHYNATWLAKSESIVTQCDTFIRFLNQEAQKETIDWEKIHQQYVNFDDTLNTLKHVIEAADKREMLKRFEEIVTIKNQPVDFSITSQQYWLETYKTNVQMKCIIGLGYCLDKCTIMCDWIHSG